MLLKTITNAGTGKGILFTRMMLELQAVKFVLLFVGVPIMVVPTSIWLYKCTPQEADLIKVDLVGEHYSGSSARRWYLRDESGEKQLIVATVGRDKVDYLTFSQVKKALDQKYSTVDTFYALIRYSFYAGLVATIGIWLGIFFFGRRMQQDERIRGSEELVSDKELSSLVKRKAGWWVKTYSFAKIALPLEAPMRGIIAIGAQGSGKSLAIHDLMRQVFASGKKCVVYDQNGEFFKAYFRPGKDVFFNPALKGSVPWSLFSELKYKYNADTLAEAFLPKKQGKDSGANGFFEDAARSLFSVILARLAEKGAKYTADIARAILSMPDDEMNHLIRESVASSAMGGDSKGQRQGVISSIAIYLNGIAAVQKGEWSVSKFFESDDDSRLFILCTEDTNSMFLPLYRLMLSVAFSAIATRNQIIHKDKYWFFMDELHTLGDIKLDEKLATLRKFGVCIVGGIQSESQFTTSMGKERAQTVMNVFNTILQLKINDTSMVKQASERLGSMEVNQASLSQQTAVTEWRDGVGLQFNIRDKQLVMGAEILSLDTGKGYLKCAGAYPVAIVDYSDWTEKRFFGLLQPYAENFSAKIDMPVRNEDFKLNIENILPEGADVLQIVKEEFASTREQDGQEDGVNEKQKITGQLDEIAINNSGVTMNPAIATLTQDLMPEPVQEIAIER